nr:protein misato homolog 1 isoform X2 [Ipomoea batatas]
MEEHPGVSALKMSSPHYTSAVYASALHSFESSISNGKPGPTAESNLCFWCIKYPPSLTGNQVQWSLLEHFVSLTPEVEQEHEDMQCHGNLAVLFHTLPFPAIFGNSVGQHGELLETPITETPSRGPLDVHSIPMASRLRSSTAILPFLESRLENLRKLAIQRGAIGAQVLESWGFGRDEVEDLGETLSKLVNTLKPYSDISSDSD